VYWRARGRPESDLCLPLPRPPIPPGTPRQTCWLAGVPGVSFPIGGEVMTKQASASGSRRCFNVGEASRPSRQPELMPRGQVTCSCSSSRPRVLDLFCKAGGSAMGLYRAGFEVVGVDIEPQPHYPFEFHQGDALTYPLDGFDAYWASPPCQRWSVATLCNVGLKDRYPDYLQAVRQRFASIGKPYVIENVPRAPLKNPLLLCGTMFGLRVRRHRHFECYPEILLAPAVCSCHKGNTMSAGVSCFSRGARLISVAGHNYHSDDARQAMGIDWMTNREELSQAIPPAYSEFIGRWLKRSING